MIIERIFYGSLRLIRFVLFFFLLGWLMWAPWLAVFVAIVSFLFAYFYHGSEEPYGYFKGRIATDVGLSAMLSLPILLFPALTPIHPDLPDAFVVGVVLSSIAIWLWFYRVEKRSIVYASRVTPWPVLRSSAFWGWVFLIIFWGVLYLLVRPAS